MAAQAWSESDMRETLGFDMDTAQKLHRWGRGRDDAPVTERAPPKTLSVQVPQVPLLVLRVLGRGCHGATRGLVCCEHPQT